MGAQERNDPAFANWRAGVPDIQMRIGYPYEDTAAILSRLGGFENGISGILDNLENLAVAVAAGEYGLFGIEVLLDEFRFDFVDLEDFAAVFSHICDQGLVR